MAFKRYLLVSLLLFPLCCALAKAQGEEIHTLYHLTLRVPSGWYRFFGDSPDELGGFLHPLWEGPSPQGEEVLQKAEVLFILRGETAKRFEVDFRESDPSLQGETITVGGREAVLFQAFQENRNLFFVFVRSDIPLAFLFALTSTKAPEVRKILEGVTIGDAPYTLGKLLGMEVLESPQGVACDPEGNIYVASASNEVAVFDPKGELLRSIGEKGTEPGKLLLPSGIAISPEGYLYIADSLNRIQKFDREGKFRGVFAQELEKPSGLACDREGNVYVVEIGASRVTKWNPKGEKVLTLGGPEELSFSDSFAGLAIGQAGEVLVSDPGHNRILVFDPSGKVLRAITRVPQVQGVYLLSGYFRNEPPPFTPTGLALDSKGRLYAADLSSLALLRFGEDGNLEVVWKLLEGHHFPFPVATLESIAGIALHSSGTIYAARSVTPYALFGFVPSTLEPPPLEVLDIRAVPLKTEKLPPPAATEEVPPAEEPTPEPEPPAEETPSPTPTAPTFSLALTPGGTEFETGKAIRFAVALTPLPENPVRYVWNFGDGTDPVTTDVESMEHTFEKPGNVTLTVKAFDGVTRAMLAMEKVTLTLKSPGPELLTAEERYPNGNVKLRYTYYLGKDGQRIKHGLEVSFYENGKKKVEGSYEHGKKEGTWTSYYDSGAIGQRGTYRGGLKEGTWTLYYRNGNKESEGLYRRDKREGKWTKWLPDGRKFAEMEYRGNQIIPGSYREF